MSDNRELLFGLAREVRNWTDLSSAVERRAGQDGDGGFWEAVRWAFSYDLVWPAATTTLIRAYSPMIELADGRSFPPPIGSVPDDVAIRWEEAAEVQHPAVRSRCLDLLLIRGGRERGRLIRGTVEAYMDLATASWDELEQSQGLSRALVIARSTHQEDLEGRLLESSFNALAGWLEQAVPPGISLTLLQHLIDLRAGPQRNRDLLDLAIDRYADNVHQLSDLLAWRAALTADGDERSALQRRRIRAWTDAAAVADPMVRILHLQTAARIAEEVNDDSEAERATRLLQEAGRSGPELQRITTDVSLPREEVDRYLASLTSSESWQENLDRFCHHAPITGNADANRAQVAELQRTAPLQGLFPRVRIGGDGLPRWTATSEAERMEAQLSQVEELNVQIGAPLLARGLAAMAPDGATRDEMTQYWMSHPTMDARTASVLAIALDLYWRGEYAASAALAIPAVESLARTLLLAADRALYRTSRENKPGVYPGLGQLLDGLRQSGWNESWWRYVGTVLAHSRGMNLRNEWAHGFSGPLSDAVAAMTLHIAGHLSVLVVGSPRQSEM